MINEIIQDAEQRMGKSTEALVTDLSKVRAGRAHPSLLDQLMIDYYGTATPIKQVANVNVTDSRTLTIVPWEKEMVAPIERAIMESDLGLNPNTAGTMIRLPMPPLTEERRKELVKVVKKIGETGKISLRSNRRDAIEMLKTMEKDKDISEDENKRGQVEIQKLTDDFVKKVDGIIVEKEKEVMSI